MTALLCSLFLSLSALLTRADSADIIFVGDAMQHQRQLDAARRPDGSFDYSACFAAVRPYIESAEYAVVNLETPLGGKPYSGYPMFCAPDEYLDALVDAGFDFFLGANNHALDRRDRGVRRTIDQFRSRGIPYAGIWRNRTQRDSLSPVIRDIRGFRVAFLNYTYGTNGIAIREDVVVDPIDTLLIDRDIDRAREAGAELTAVCVHWGEEYEMLPRRSQKHLADYLASRGVDMVIGAHPHVIQPIEMRQDSASGHRTLIVWSLGNFISGMRTRDTRGGAAVRVRLSRDSVGTARIDTATYRLFFTVTPAAGSGDNFRLVPAELPVEGNSVAESQRKAFFDSAEKIYKRHNIGVGRDTTAIPRRNPRPETKTN
ncbi:MAG: CapA family protein [Clostridium sp.]|nr:CapA family protein [Clostridium sp.]